MTSGETQVEGPFWLDIKIELDSLIMLGLFQVQAFTKDNFIKLRS